MPSSSRADRVPARPRPRLRRKAVSQNPSPEVGPARAAQPDESDRPREPRDRLDDYIESIRLIVRILERFGAGQ